MKSRLPDDKRSKNPLKMKLFTTYTVETTDENALQMMRRNAGHDIILYKDTADEVCNENNKSRKEIENRHI